ncbi:hypothetical protein TTHERM_000763059 (macronuclear) [Tetrahymena thermophila SB210]|uniref:HD domain-containing protein n=1 Tax=Tetrahymena thermophila (strain SB210) TaxID=312017 RepID=W7WXP8_TETTS|nr:hypothetical protein TTHERM_000763059 [Tetrahymena thermophila SB210]EWS71610.1 hypothetical protein TTHERM_000763059 [Tetrahymena thermophila SB210]|eukprot:XP_012655855.1 hypothetical protein TTHERM_000763059 [Tetrahymena thermophila SB210]
MNGLYPLFKDHFADVIDIVQKDVKDWKSLLNILNQRISNQDFNFQIYENNSKFQDILTHILKVFFCLMNDTNFMKSNQYNQEILLWTAFFHDCAKLAPPLTVSPDGRDPAHPFRSCHKTLIYLNHLQLLKFSKSQLNQWNYLFEQAYNIVTIEEKLVQTHNMNILPKLILFIEKEVQSPFFQTVLKLICLHQCIPCCKYPPVSPIDLRETSLYFNKQELKLLQVFWQNDSYSYCYDSNEIFEFGKEIEQKINDAIMHLHTQ